VHHFPRETGWIEVICGSMFSGKTEELIRRLRRAAIARQQVQVFKPVIDNRYDAERIASHTGQTFESRPILDIEQVLEHLRLDTRVVGLDEAQFFSERLAPVCEELANRGLRVLVATLDQDFRGEPFPAVPRLLCVAEYVTKMEAICVVCGNPANRSQRIVQEGDRVLVGGKDAYEARCRRCFRPFAIDQPDLPGLPGSDPRA
jgi:thymidine kinase